MPVLIRSSAAVTAAACVPAGASCCRHPTHERFLNALLASSFAFFLFSWQVHEKAILLSCVPAVLLNRTAFVVMAAFSLLPLLAKDGQLLAGLALPVLWIAVAALLPLLAKD